ncbi:NDST1 [Cordylochernes scorpioides]|uniref:NDST1 n=1 Tax=Cordylochernes scorpioides TaxID=51811 RepID=A0ABY6L3V5_9ARAC|nr:NDST1 [Cordylochernes scorpioides]
MLTSLDKGKFAAVVFENMERFLSMSKWNKELLLKYCREYHVGIVGFLRPAAEEPAVVPPRPGFPHTVHSRLELYNARLNPDSPVLRLTRPGEVYRGQLPGDWSVLVPPNSSYVPVAWAQPLYPPAPVNGSSEPTELVTVLQDPGIGDQVPKVLFGSGFQFWLHRLLFLDALSFLSHGKLSLPLQRHLLIDIDDIFVGERGHSHEAC